MSRMLNVSWALSFSVVSWLPARIREGALSWTTAVPFLNLSGLCGPALNVNSPLIPPEACVVELFSACRAAPMSSYDWPPIQVNDIRGFETVYVNGKTEPVSSSHPARIRIGGQSYELIGAARHAENNSTTQASGGISGELTLRAGPHSPDKFKKGTAVVHDNAPSLIRAGNHDTTEKLSAQDTLSMRLILKAMTALKHNTGLQPPFKLFLDSESMFQLYDDPQFQSLYRGQYGSDAMQRGRIVHLLGIDFIDTTESVLQPMAKDKGAEIVVRRPILVAQGALIEADFPWKQTAYQQMNSVLHVVDGVAHITRAAINRTGDVIAQTWTWIGGFAAPSDSTANRRIIPTANDAYYKRAVIIEHAS